MNDFRATNGLAVDFELGSVAATYALQSERQLIFCPTTRVKNMGQKHIEIQLPSRLWYIEPVLALLKQLAQQLGFCQERIADIQLAIDEICGNAIEHGSEDDDRGIAISIDVNDHQLDILVRDKGTQDREDWLTTGNLEEIYQRRAPDQERGHGIYVVEQLSDKVKMEPNSFGGTDVRVSFSLPTDELRPRNPSPSTRPFR